MLMIGRRLRWNIAPGIVRGIETIADSNGTRFNIPAGEARLFHVFETMGVQTERPMGPPLLMPTNFSLDYIECFPDHFRPREDG